MSNYGPASGGDPTAQSEDTSLISEIARQRRARVGQDLVSALPSFVTDIEQTEVAYTLEPKYFPVSHMDVSRLIRLMEEAYGLALGRLDLSPLMARSAQRELVELSELPQEQLVERLLRANGGQVDFENGRVPSGRNDFVPIRQVSLNAETVLSSVQGTGEVAEVLAQEVAELVWICAGAKKPWSQIEPHVQLKAFGTGTLVDFGAFEKFLNPVISTFFDQEIVDGRRFGAEVSAHMSADSFGPPSNCSLSWAMDDLYVVVNRFDTLSGAYYRSRLKFSVITRTGYRTGQVLVSSEMPFNVHIEMVQALVEALAEP